MCGQPYSNDHFEEERAREKEREGRRARDRQSAASGRCLLDHWRNRQFKGQPLKNGAIGRDGLLGGVKGETAGCWRRLLVVRVDERREMGQFFCEWLMFVWQEKRSSYPSAVSHSLTPSLLSLSLSGSICVSLSFSIHTIQVKCYKMPQHL